VSETREKSVFLGMAWDLEDRGLEVKILCTDGYEAYSYYKLAERHIITKAETSLVESKNSLISLVYFS
jgi:IS1 family transposase